MRIASKILLGVLAGSFASPPSAQASTLVPQTPLPGASFPSSQWRSRCSGPATTRPFHGWMHWRIHFSVSR